MKMVDGRNGAWNRTMNGGAKVKSTDRLESVEKDTRRKSDVAEQNCMFMYSVLKGCVVRVDVR